MKPFVAIGSERSGKSTLIRSLTGCKTRSFCGVVTVSNQKIYVIASSPQEQELSSDDLSYILKKAADDASILGIVMAIQPKITRLSMENIFRKVQDTRDFSTFAVILHPSYSADSPPIDSKEIRRRLELVLVGSIKKIDGRHFAHLNACEEFPFYLCVSQNMQTQILVIQNSYYKDKKTIEQIKDFYHVDEITASFVDSFPKKFSTKLFVQPLFLLARILL